MTLRRARSILEWISLGIGHRGRVLDIGSGNSPHPRADVLCDRYLATTGHRKAPVEIDRRLVCGDLRALPFRSKEFAFVICRMVLEHIDAEYLPTCLAELSRVAESGYIETPSAICELLMPDHCHVNFVELSDGMLTFTPKKEAVPYPPIGRELMSWRRTSPQWQRFVLDDPDRLSIRYRWSGSIRYAIREPAVCPQTSAATAEEVVSICDSASLTANASILRKTTKSALRMLFHLPGFSR